jgi:hypothetical protein
MALDVESLSGAAKQRREAYTTSPSFSRTPRRRRCCRHHKDAVAEPLAHFRDRI